MNELTKYYWMFHSLQTFDEVYKSTTFLDSNSASSLDSYNAGHDTKLRLNLFGCFTDNNIFVFITYT